MIGRIFKYLEPMWLGNDKRVSIRRVLAIIFSIDFVKNISFVIHNWVSGQSYADIAMLLGLEAGLIAALLALTTYANMIKKSETTTSYPTSPNETD